MLDLFAAHPPTPPGLVHPPAVWVYNVVIPVVAVAIFAVFSWQSWKRRTLTWWWLFFVVGASCFWLETFGDWGQYLVYSPDFWHYHVPLSHTSPDNPWFMPAAYGLYWGVHAILVLRIAERVARRLHLSRGWGVLILAAPFGYAWDIVVETTSAHFGWWSYETPIGPYFDAGRGLQPLVVPIVVMFTWPNLMAWLVGDPRDTTPNVIDRLFRLERLKTPAEQAVRTRVLVGAGGLAESVEAVETSPRWNARYELARLGAWVLVFWVTFAVLLDVVLIVLRETIGHPSAYVP